MKEPVVSMTLDLQKSSEDTVVSLKEGNTVGKLAIRLSEEGFPYEIAEDCYAVLTAAKPDGNILYNHCTIDGNEIIYEITEQTTAAAGRMTAEIRLYGKDDQLVTSAAFRIIVSGTVYNDDRVESKDEVSALTHLVSEAANAADIAAAAAETVEKVAEDAGKAISGADTAAKNANSAAGAANQAAGSANNAAAAATTAAGNANTAAGKANTAAANAGAATTEVIAAKDSFLETAGNALEEIRDIVNDGTDAPPIVSSANGEMITLDDSADRLLRGLKVFGKTTQNGTPAPDAPVPLESVGNVTVTVAGKNLFDVPHIAVNGTGNRKDNANQSIADGVLRITRVNITGKAPKFFVNLGTAVPFLGKTLYLKAKAKASTSVAKFGFGIGFYKETTNSIKNAAYSAFPSATTEQELSCTFIVPDTLDESSPNLGMVVYADNAAAITTQAVGDYVDYWDIMISFDDVAYEPYKEAQTLSISTLNGLLGIPVDSGGNYTDGNGQQWICDEVDFEKGVYVQRVATKTYNGSETWTISSLNAPFGTDENDIMDCTDRDIRLLCNRYPAKNISDSWIKYDYLISRAAGNSKTLRFRNVNISTLEEWKAHLAENPIIVQYILAQENPIPLSADQLAAFAALHTHYPNTTVFNDAGAHMEVQYVADTKLYIDENVAELVDLIMDLEPGGSVSEEQVAQVVEEVLEEHPKLQDLEAGVAGNAAAIGNKQNTLVPGVNIKTINGKSILGSGNLEIAGSNGGSPDWNAMEGEPGHVMNRTHYSYKPFEDIVFNFADGNKLESMDGSSIGFGTIYKISDYPLTGDDFNNSTILVIDPDGGTSELSFQDSGNSVENVLYLYYIFLFGESPVGAVASIHVPGNYMGLDFSRGTFITMAVDISGSDECITITREEVFPLPEKYIPPEIARITELEDTISSVKAWRDSVLKGILADSTTAEVKSGYFEYALLRQVRLSGAKKIGSNAFRHCPFLMEVSLLAVTEIGSSAFYDCPELADVGLGLATYIGSEAFRDCSKLTSLHIGGTSKCNIGSNVFKGTPFESGEGSISVPNNLLDEYKNDSNWSKYASVINGYEV